MLRYTIRRLVGAIPTMFALIAITFFIMRIAPGGPFDGNRKVTEIVKANLEAAYHLDDPLWMQFLRYLWGVLHFDFGPSYKYRDYTVSELIWQGFPISLEVGMWAMAIATVVGVTLGTVAALRQHSMIDYGVMAVGMTGVAVPTFVDRSAACSCFFGASIVQGIAGRRLGRQHRREDHADHRAGIAEHRLYRQFGAGQHDRILAHQPCENSACQGYRRLAHRDTPCA